MFSRVFLCLFLSDDCRDRGNTKCFRGGSSKIYPEERLHKRAVFYLHIYRHSATAVTEMKRSGIEVRLACSPGYFYTYHYGSYLSWIDKVDLFVYNDIRQNYGGV